MKSQVSFAVFLITFGVTLATAVLGYPAGFQSHSIQKKRGIWSSLSCLKKNCDAHDTNAMHMIHDITDENPCDENESTYQFVQNAHYLKAEEYLKFHPKDFEAVYGHVLHYLEAINVYSSEAVELLEDNKGFTSLSLEEGNELINDAVSIWQESFWVLLTIKPRDWTILFKKANAEESSLLKERKKIAHDKIEYLHFLIWLHASDTPFEKLKFIREQKYGKQVCE